MNVPLRQILLTITLLGAFFCLNAQDEKEKKKDKFDAGTALIISPTYTAQFPFGTMRDRFGFNSHISMNFWYKLKKNWVIGAEGGFLFGNQVRDSYILDRITTTTGQNISQNNTLVSVRPAEQGFTIKAQFGKIIPFTPKFPDAGLLLLTGFGFLQHKIALNVRESSLPQLSKTYRKGYDRMCNGPVLSQFVGYAFMARRKLYSFYGGLQFDVAFTGERRAYDFYAMKKLDEKRVDLFLGIKVGWILPIFLQSSETEYYYY